MATIRRIWENTRNPEQWTFQIQDTVKAPVASNSLMVGVLQGIENPGKNTVMTLVSVHKDVAQEAGYEIGDYIDEPLSVKPLEKKFSDAYGQTVSIDVKVFENFSPNPRSTTQVPKQPGPNSSKVLCATDENGEQHFVYRHTFLGLSFEDGSSQDGLTLANANQLDTSYANLCEVKDGNYFIISNSRIDVADLPDEIAERFGNVGVGTFQQEVESNI